MNATFDIEDGDEAPCSVKEEVNEEEVVELRQPKPQPLLFNDIDALQQRKSILSFESNFEIMQTGGYHHANSDGINYGCMNGAEFLENELIPEELLDDMYNMSETGSMGNASVNNQPNISNRRFSNKNSFSLLNVDEKELPQQDPNHEEDVDRLG